MGIFLKIWRLLSPSGRVKLLLLTVMMGAGALMELAGLGLVMPLIAVLANPELLEQNKILKFIYELASPSSNAQFILMLCLVLSLAYAVKNIYLLLLTKFQAQFVYSRVAELGARLFERYLKAPYAFHLKRNSSSFMNNLNMLTFLSSGVMMPAMLLATDCIVVGAILVTLVVLAPLLTLGLGIFAGVLTLGLYFAMLKFNVGTGERLQANRIETTRIAMQSFEGVKECKVLNCEDAMASQYSLHQRLLRNAEADQIFAGQVPRFAIETIVVISGMAALSALLLCGVAIGSIILRLSFVTIAMVRLMPSLSRMNYNIANIKQNLPILRDIIVDFESLKPEPAPQGAPLEFKKSIKIEDVSFHYEGTDKDTLSNFSLEISKNASVAFVGHTGCGKTTLVDIILGLLKPTGGRICVDGRDISENLPSWQTKIGYVPQVIHLVDGSIKENVAFCVEPEKIDAGRVRKCLETAQLWEFVETLSGGMEAVIGERGVRLSGGQRQRIGIARALYHDPQILALDEATSALDVDTEKAFIDALRTLKGKLTLITIAHRLTTVQGCDMIVNLANPAGTQASNAG